MDLLPTTSPPGARVGNGTLLPEFCTPRAILSVVVVCLFVAIVVGLLLPPIGNLYWTRFTLLAIYIQWLGLSDAVVMCWARRLLSRMPAWFVMAAAYCLMLGMTALLADLAWIALEFIDPTGQLVAGSSLSSRSQFVISSLGITGIVAALALRYFWVQDQWRAQVKAEAESRYQALQARIRPHFLFNTLNSLAALIRRDPDLAETIVADLSDLFRVSLEQRQRVVTLSEELEITRSYLNIEQVRAGDRLKLEWHIDDTLLDTQVPLLSIQPLVENAVHHGVMQLDAGGTITISARRVVTKKERPEIEISVVNPAPTIQPASTGTQLALGNLSERLRLVYGEHGRLDAQRVEVSDDNGHVITEYRATVILPVLAPSPKANLPQ